MQTARIQTKIMHAVAAIVVTPFLIEASRGYRITHGSTYSLDVYSLID
ncbi:MAG: hypothetical protein V3S89_00385 [Desulfobacterales bacterium]